MERKRMSLPFIHDYSCGYIELNAKERKSKFQQRVELKGKDGSRNGELILDFDEGNKLIGIEILGVMKVLHLSSSPDE